MTASQRTFAFVFLLAGLLAIFAAALYQRMLAPSLTQFVDARPISRPEQQAMPGSSGAPLPGPDGNELVALMARLKENPGDLDSVLRIAAIFSRNKDWPNALGFLRRAAELAPADMRPPYFLGVALTEKGDYADAVASFEKALLLQPANPAAQFNLAVLYRHYLNQPAKAKELFESIVANNADEAVTARARQELAAMS